ncbi:nuclear transport factor 2 family protein [Leptolyngbya sp. 7M]|uniref:oxidoreductase n=1 Tax=Leptolyngbya sp. 7M TaxID=2812896 RepID=UPI001B8D7C14|nr:nuclear transport factor 2 family protein [Leptolyngbya sp. 7M]QYO66955.1 nuclear transport factor 2 family protein [Leptolyngbya sp. 7M]
MTNRTIAKTLLSPFDLAGLPLKNRVVMAPLTRGRAGKERIPNALMAEYYAQRASVGLIISEGATISKQANGWLNSPGIYSEEQTQAWKPVVNAVHTKGTPFFLQLWHTGRASHSSFQENGQLPVSASAIRLQDDDIHTPIGKQPYETPRALETNEIPLIVEDYRQAAQNAQAAGFDGVEIHAGYGYLIDEFLQSKTNQRTDQYGGSLENRYRFLNEIVEAVLTVFPANRVGVRLSPNSTYNDMGSPDFRETFLYVAQQLNQYSLGYLALIDGLEFNGFHQLGKPMGTAEFRDVFTGAIIANGDYTQETASIAVHVGNADLIGFGRLIISNPDLVERFANGWSLNPPADPSVWFSFDKEGYTDFPTYSESQNIQIVQDQQISSDVTRTVVKQYFDRLQSGAEPEAIAALFSEDIDWNIPGNINSVLWIGRRKGRSGVADFIRELREQDEPIRFEIRSIVVEGEQAVALGNFASQIRKTGNIIESEFALEFIVQAGLIVRYRLFEDSFAVAQAAQGNPIEPMFSSFEKR